MAVISLPRRLSEAHLQTPKTGNHIQCLAFTDMDAVVLSLRIPRIQVEVDDAQAAFIVMLKRNLLYPLCPSFACTHKVRISTCRMETWRPERSTGDMTASTVTSPVSNGNSITCMPMMALRSSLKHCMQPCTWKCDATAA